MPINADSTTYVAHSVTRPFFTDEELDTASDDSDSSVSTVRQQKHADETNAALEEVHEILVNSLIQGDMSMVAHAWSRLKQGKLTSPEVVPRSYLRQCSELISELDIQTKTLDSNTIQALDELAAYTVADGQGLRSRTRHYLENNNPNAALRIVQMAYSYLQERNSWLSQLQRKTTPDEYARITAVYGDAGAFHYKCIGDAIAACAMNGSFRPMLGLGIYDKKLSAAMQPLMTYAASMVEELALHQTKFRRWVLRFFDLHRFALEPLTFAKYVTQIGASTSTAPLAHLAKSIVSELSEDEPCLTLDQKASADAATASEYPLVVLRDENWAQLMLNLIRARRIADAERLWIDMTRLGAKIPMLVWAAVIEGFGALKMFGRVHAAWSTFCSTQPTPAAGAVVHRAYITALFDEGRPKDALAVFETFDKRIRKELEPAESAAVVSVYNAVLEWLVQQSRVAEAQQIFEHMKASGSTRPDVESYNIFIQHASRSKDLKAVAGIIREMQALGMTGNVYTASVLLAAVYPMRTDAVELVLALLRQAGVQVDVKVCNSLLDHLVRSPSDEAIAAAVQLLDHMETSPDIRSDELSYIRILCGIERRVWKDPSLAARYRRAIIEKMARQRRRLTRSIATRNVIEACFERPGPEGVHRAMIYYRRYRQDRLRYNRQFEYTIWGHLLAKLALRREWEIADELSKEILESGQALPTGLQRLLSRVKDRSIEDMDQFDT